jgi:hypothetical protein
MMMIYQVGIGQVAFFSIFINNLTFKGPGAYDVVSLKNKFHQFAALNDRRWKDSNNHVPGPADYEVV